jgi:adenosylcobinamide-GDP ribazoletransferase
VLPLPWLLDYARETDDSKSRTMVAERFNGGMLAYSSLFVLLPLLFLNVPPLWYALANAGIVALVMGLYFKKRLGGYSGDCLGGVQQVTEVVVYLSLLGSWNSL